MRLIHWIGYGIAAIAVAVAIWLYVENQDLRNRPPEAPKVAQTDAPVRANDPWARDAPDVPARVGLGKDVDTTDAPKLPAEKEESRMERRARRQAQLAAFLGRDADETEDEYRQRILPLLQAALAQPRSDVADMRAEAEKAANVTPEQHAKLDAAFDKTYDDLIQYTDGAVADGELTPYSRNVAGMLDYAGGLGGILQDAQTQIGGILSPEQIQSMSANGFEWAEYLGLSAPWERLHAPPPPPGGGS
jgi:hypothetical protein